MKIKKYSIKGKPNFCKHKTKCPIMVVRHNYCIACKDYLKTLTEEKQLEDK